MVCIDKSDQHNTYYYSWFATLEGISKENCGHMSNLTEYYDKRLLEDKVMNYIRKLAGLDIVVPVCDIAHDIGMTENAVLIVMDKFNIALTEIDQSA